MKCSGIRFLLKIRKFGLGSYTPFIIVCLYYRYHIRQPIIFFKQSNECVRNCVTTICINCNWKNFMPHIRMVTEGYFKDTDKTSSNLGICPKAACQGDFPTLPTEINGFLPWFNATGISAKMCKELHSIIKVCIVWVYVTFTNVCSVPSTTGLRLLGTTTT